MGVIVNKNDQDENELSRRIAADLRRKEMARDGKGVSKVKRSEDPDLAEDAEYMKNLKKTSKFGWVWIVLIVLAIGALISIVMI